LQQFLCLLANRKGVRQAAQLVQYNLTTLQTSLLGTDTTKIQDVRTLIKEATKSFQLECVPQDLASLYTLAHSNGPKALLDLFWETVNDFVLEILFSQRAG